MSGDELKEGVVGATVVILQRLRVRAPEAEDRPVRGWDPRITPRRSSSLGGKNGSSVITRDRRFDIPAVTLDDCRSHGGR